MPDEVPEPNQEEEKQCRICLDGPDDTLGRLIQPCLCRGSISVRLSVWAMSAMPN